MFENVSATERMLIKVSCLIVLDEIVRKESEENENVKEFLDNYVKEREREK